jgi:tRNA-splicing ligase RtcB
MAAIRFHGSADLLSTETAAARLLAGLYRLVPTMRHARATMPTSLPEPLASMPLSHPALERLKPRDGRVQLGTLGRGNHFLEFQRDEDDALWVLVHSGSRGLGQAVSAHHAEVARPLPKSAGLYGFEAESPEGEAYLADAAWAEHYAEANRAAMIGAATGLMRELFDVAAEEASFLNVNHNHVRREVHCGERLWVHRKGAMPAHADAPGVIPGSMGTASFYVVGRGCEAALCSSSHGAGRAKSRTEAAQSIGEKQLLREMSGIWFDQRRVHALRDEAPSAYKDIRAVMRAQRELTRIVRELRPVLSYKGT